MENSGRKNGRLVWLDYCKTIAITLVILFHTGVITCKITVPLLAMCVPLFFVINGGLVLRCVRDVRYFIRKMFKILFMIVFWGAISDLIIVLLKGEPLDIVDLAFAGINFKFGYAHHLWFLCTLLALYAIYPAIQGSMKNRNVAVFVLITSFLFSFLAFGYRLPTFKIPNVLAFRHGEAFFYAILGCVIVNHVYIDSCSNYLRIGVFNKEGQKDLVHSVKMNRMNFIILLVLVFITLWIGQLLMFYGTEFFTKHTPASLDEAVFYLYNSPFVMLMVAMLVLLLKLINPMRNKLVEFIGGNTLGMYVLHWIFMSLTRNYVVCADLRVANLITFVSTCALSLLCTWIMSKNKISRFLITL